MWCETDGEKEDRRPNGDVGIEGNSGSDGKGEWSEMVRPRKTWRSQVEKESKSVDLKKEDAKNRARWRVGVGEIAGRMG